MKIFYGASIFCIIMLFAGAGAAMDVDPSNFANVTPGDGVVYFATDVEFDVFVLNVTGPGHAENRKTFKYKEEIYFKLVDECGEPLPDGVFRYQILLRPVLDDELKKLMDEAAKDDAMRMSCIARYLPRYAEELGTTWEQTGAFTIKDGKFVREDVGRDDDTGPRGDGKAPLRPEDHLVYDDAIITGSICVGFDCVNGESFGYCTEKLKENNLQLCFEDTSAGSFPTNDWKIQINDTSSGGASYFTIWDTDAGRRPFTIEAGAPAHSLYVEDYGRIGFGTSIPYVELHIKDGDTPTIRLDQDGSSGWAAQSWDMAGNETNFFVRDVTNGSKLSFRIQPNTPSSTLSLRSTGYVGVGTWSPGYPLEVETTNEHSVLFLDRTDGVQAFMSAQETEAFFGTSSDDELRFAINGNWRMKLNETADSDILEMTDGGTYDGTWNPGSSRAYKENIQDLSSADALNAFKELKPVRYNYLRTKDEERLGFIAEDVPDLVAMNGRKNLNAMDIVAVLTKVLEKQQKLAEQQQETISRLNERLTKMEKKLR